MSTTAPTMEGNAERVPFIAACGLLPFIEEHLWIADHLEDVKSDLSAFHEVRDFETLDGPSFFALASRLGHYRGAVRDRIMAEEHERQRAKREGVTTTDATNDDLADLRAAGLVEWEG